MMFNNTNRLSAMAVAAGIGGAVAAACGSPVVLSFSGSHDNGHAAQATFTFDHAANQVTINLANITPPAYNSVDSRWLTGLFWDMAPSTLPWSEVAGSHGGIEGGNQSATPTQYWAFRDDLGSSSPPHGQQFGLGAAGFGVFGNDDMLEPGGPHPQPGGIDGGVLSEHGDPHQGGGHERLMFRDFVEFTFTLPAAWFPSDPGEFAVSDVWFQFGSGFDEPGFWFEAPPDPPPPPPIPLPSAAGMAALGLIAIMRRRARLQL